MRCMMQAGLAGLLGLAGSANVQVGCSKHAACYILKTCAFSQGLLSNYMMEYMINYLINIMSSEYVSK